MSVAFEGGQEDMRITLSLTPRNSFARAVGIGYGCA